jgi:hypothetical protein
MRCRLVWIAVALAAADPAFAQAKDKKLDRMVSRLLPLTRDVSSQFDAIARRVRRDSGSARADSTAFEFWRKPWAVTRRLDTMTDVDIHVAIDPEGDVAAEEARKGKRIDHSPAAQDSLTSMLVASGVRPHIGEGPLYFALSAAEVLRRVDCCVSAAMRQYFSMEQEAQERPAAADGSLMVPLDTLVDRMIRAEQYMASHPTAVALPEVTYNRDRYLGWILYGITISTAFHFRTLELHPDYLRAMERLASTRPMEHSGKMAQAMLDLVKANGFRRTPAVTEYIRVRWTELRPPQ